MCTSDIAENSASPGASMSSGTHDHIWYVSPHGLMTALDGPVVPEVNSSVETSVTSGPSKSVSGSVAASSVAQRDGR